MELYKGRPENTDGRQEREIRVYDCLDKLGIEYERTDHEHADTMEACNFMIRSFIFDSQLVQAVIDPDLPFLASICIFWSSFI